MITRKNRSQSSVRVVLDSRLRGNDGKGGNDGEGLL